MTSLLDDALLPTDPEALAAEITELEARLAASSGEIKRLMAEEDVAAGIFRAEEIHAAKQLHMALRYQKDLRTARRNRLLAG